MFKHESLNWVYNKKSISCKQASCWDCNVWAWVWKRACNIASSAIHGFKVVTSSRFPPIVGGCWFCPGRARGSGNWEGGERGMLLKIPAALDRERREREGERGGEFPGLFKASFKAAIRRKTFSTSGKQDGPNSASAAVGRAELSELPQWGEGKGPWRGGRRLLGVEEGHSEFLAPLGLLTYPCHMNHGIPKPSDGKPQNSASTSREPVHPSAQRGWVKLIFYFKPHVFITIYTFVWLRWGYLIWRLTKKVWRIYLLL